MAEPACPHCRGTTFELRDATDIQGSSFTYAIVRCAGCGAPIGVLEDQSISAILADQAAVLDDLGGAVARIESAMADLVAEVRQLRRNTES